MRKEKEEKQNNLKLQPKFRTHPPGTSTIKYISNLDGNKLFMDKDVHIF